MKKLNLKKLKLEANEMLQRNQLKTVFGGKYDSSSSGCITKGNLCNGYSDYPSTLCCSNLTCKVTGMNIGLCK